MSRPRNLALAVACATALLAAFTLRPWMKGQALQVEGAPRAALDDKPAGNLEDDRQRVLQQAELYQGVLGRLARREASLDEAAEALRLRLESQGVSEQLLAAFPAPTPQESYRRAVIDHVGRYLRDDPHQTQVVRRLEGELAEQVARGAFPAPASPMAATPSVSRTNQG
jgi:hypothetical protein